MKIVHGKKYKFEIGGFEVRCTYWENTEGLNGYLVELIDDEWAGETIILGVSDKKKINKFVKALSAIINDIPREKTIQ